MSDQDSGRIGFGGLIERDESPPPEPALASVSRDPEASKLNDQALWWEHCFGKPIPPAR